MNNKKRNTVYIISMLISVAMAAWGILGSKSFENAANALMKAVTVNMGWLYLIAMLIFVVFALIVAFSKYGNIKLGADDSKPEYSLIFLTFCAGRDSCELHL